MAQGYVGFDTAAPAGSKFSDEVVAELNGVVDSDIANGEVTTAKLHDAAVTTDKIDDAAVTSAKIGAKQVKTANVDDLAVGTAQLAANAVTPAKAGTGMVTAFDNSGNPVSIKLVKVTAAQYAAIVTKDPATYYFVSA